METVATILAHIKWFASFDVHTAPRPIAEVLDRTFIKFFIGSVVVVVGFFLADRTIYRRRVLATLDARLKKLDEFSILILRLSAAVFLTSVWAWYMAYHTAFYVTPELKTGLWFVPWFQLALAVCALFRRTLPALGIGLLLLYAMAVRTYGVFHLLDYFIFLGLGYFFAVVNVKRGKWRQSAFVVLFAGTGITLLWAAMEKFAYPQWTYPVLQIHPDMLLGMQPATYMILAGFMEFGVAFILLGAASIVGRLVALGLQLIFMLAIFKFGLLDAVGHLMIIAILFVLFVRGPTSAREILVLKEKSIWMETYFMTGLYFLAFVVIFISYYGLHSVFYDSTVQVRTFNAQNHAQSVQSPAERPRSAVQSPASDAFSKDLKDEIEQIAATAQGKVGVSAWVIETGETLSLNGGEHFPMQSVYKLPISMAVMKSVDAGKIKLTDQVSISKNDLVGRAAHSPIRSKYPNGVSLTVEELLRFALSESDGTASDVLMRLASGPAAVQAYLTELGIKDMIVLDTEQTFTEDKTAQYRNWATPEAAVAVLRALHERRGISESSQTVLLKFLIESKPGAKRLKGLLPSGTTVAHKTGTSGTENGITAATNDIGIITLPNGRHLAIAVFVSDSPADEATREGVIARIARAVYDAVTRDKWRVKSEE